MFSTALVIVVVLVSFVLNLLLYAGCLRLGLRWAKAENTTKKQLAIATLGVAAVSTVCEGVARFVALSPQVPQVAAMGFALVSIIVLQIAVIRRVFNLDQTQGLKAWSTTLLSPVVSLLVVVAIIIPFVAEAFKLPTNSMAPTLLGQHLIGICNECGAPAYFSPAHPQYPDSQAKSMICRDHFHITPATSSDDQVHGGDRMLVAKFLRPQRWDLIVFRFPPDPSVNYVKRLVGLPGETIEIKDGAVWADGKKLTPPDAIKDLVYVTEIPGNPIQKSIAGTSDRPAKLEANEFFVLGDFTTNAYDSRLWQNHAADHPYAVPAENLIGVVTHIYWPPQRWRAFK